MESQLTKILATTRRGLQERKLASSTRTLEQAAAAHQPRGFARALRQKAASGPAVIAELKKASPSKGLIRPDFDPAVLAATVARGGAAALSVLTDEPFFQGSLHNLEVASQSCNLPCLRKDFIVDEFQLLEARAHRADAVLLIAAALSDLELRQLTSQAHALELDVLCEVHTSDELERVLDLDCDAVGVNNRDLKDVCGTARSLARSRRPAAGRGRARERKWHRDSGGHEPVASRGVPRLSHRRISDAQD